MGKLFRRVLLSVNLLALMVLWAVAACGWVPAQTVPMCGVLCMMFPLFVGVNVVFVPLWLLVRPRLVWVPVAGMLLCCGSIQTYCPMANRGAKVDTTGVLRVMTYNTHGWGTYFPVNADNDARDKIVPWIVAQEPDVVLLQEISTEHAYAKQFEDAGYRLLVPQGMKSPLGVATRLPVVGYDTLALPSMEQNGAMAASIVWRDDTLTVVCVHLESFHLQDGDKGEYRSLVKHPARDNVQTKGRALMGKLCPVLAMHGVQADSLAGFVEHELEMGRRVILGGDFNDVPNSYACSRMSGMLADCYRAAGRGPGFTFSEQLMYFRIDHLFCSPSFQVLQTWTDKMVRYSDHHPVICDLRE